MSGCVVAAFCRRALAKAVNRRQPPDHIASTAVQSPDFVSARCSGGVGAGRTGAIGASAVVAGIGAVGALTRVVITARAAAIGANTDGTRVGTVGALAGSALVVVHPVGRAMLPVHMPVVQIVHVVGV